ncbi:hypothetical protein BDZ85DRAFT_107471 [Elsinoe ampelina]|uniref:Uncharacterized protein n=1 Tax=Elsinoe ampelina TaxID=302913 RepID=A0A6A6GCN2_9PEZI|nr:hypothetical protein BDZ85DRAFT_107471 [Elsinoe ampelina]
MDMSTPPSIRISHSSRHKSPNRYPHSYSSFPQAASPMSIPNSDRAQAPPPPLPPPTNVEELGLTTEQSWPFNNNPNWQGFCMGGRSESSSDSRSRKNSGDIVLDVPEIDPARKPSSAATITSGIPRDILNLDEARTPSDEAPAGESPNYR